MDKFGCTTPYGKNKSNISIDKTSALNVSKLYWDVVRKMNRTTVRKASRICPKSCTSMPVSISKISNNFEHNLDPDIEWQVGSVSLRFPEYVKVMKSKLAYGGLELLAEVGGYVGLFLGVSVNQLVCLSRNSFAFMQRKVQYFISKF